MQSSRYGYIRIAAASPILRIGNPYFNAEQIIALWRQAEQEDADFLLFPELCLTGYSCQDLFYQDALHRAALDALLSLVDFSRDYSSFAVVGMPLLYNTNLYNVAVLLGRGKIYGVVPKIYLPSSQEYYEYRWFRSGKDILATTISLAGYRDIPFGADLLFYDAQFPAVQVGIEICEDLWNPLPPSSEMAVAGATLLLNLSSSNELLGKAAYRRELVKHQSARTISAYAYASAGVWESTTDTVFAGHLLIAENGELLKESSRFSLQGTFIIADVDLERIVHDRLYHTSFRLAEAHRKYRRIPLSLAEKSWKQKTLYRSLSRTPFVPEDPQQRALHCKEIFSIQTSALARRLLHTDLRHVFIGVSGGLDSTLALLVAVKAYELLNWERTNIHAVVMPGPGSSERTQQNAQKLAEYLGVSVQVISITPAVLQHLQDIQHSLETADVTVENAQARERTQILMDLANKYGGIVVGTGDLSELALGWCTYNGDHMAMYNVNAGVPKTLVRYLIHWCAEEQFKDEPVAPILFDILATPITPELIPQDNLQQPHTITQQTEDILGPYEVHDFILYFMLRYHFSPKKIFYLASIAFSGKYEEEQLFHWMEIFYRRFFANQFKRNVLPEGPKVGSVSLSPRTDWRMPGDADGAVWMREIAQMRQEIFH